MNNTHDSYGKMESKMTKFGSLSLEKIQIEETALD